MGLAVAHALAARTTWTVHLVDLRPPSDSTFLGTHRHFHPVDLTDYHALATVFKAIYAHQSRVDFVFANAGTIEKSPSMLELEVGEDDDDRAPPEPSFGVLDVNLRGCVNTVHLARHFIVKGKRKEKGERGSIVVNASVSSFWPTYWAPVYTASKCKSAVSH
jgi:NAD(P)-dependent dehydrogenase (short-subunit alcohol dehydrogenase family)